ncbi:hypothetical protein BDV98DRAFT_577856 [Pterulicium gracile]|uniref:Uncharacterized protein n=1 Tax=Pterulicium gracile TaxID=1884261 RepID=A0A5C3Q1B6_9AGAR|nr:hypothetical protein BDV98DRAFT_577856 [Pterula gracilis]
MPPKADDTISVQTRCFEDDEKALPDSYTVQTSRLVISRDASVIDLCSMLEDRLGGGYSIIEMYKFTTLLKENADSLDQILDRVMMNNATVGSFYDPAVELLFAFIIEAQAAPARPQTVPVAAGDEESDSLSPLSRELDRIIPLYRTRPTPSAAATSTGYETEQGTTDAGVVDGRVTKNGPARSAPAIELYDPVFGEFLNEVHSTGEIPLEVRQQTAKFMRKLSIVRHSEAMRTEDIQSSLNDLLQAVFLRVVNRSGTVADAVSVADTSGHRSACRVVVEWKGELGSGGCEPSVQASFSYVSVYTSKEREEILRASNCPCFLISIGGSWISVSGAIFTTRPIVQRLTDYLWVGRARVQDSKQVLKIARVINALLNSLQKLLTYYNKLAIPGPLPQPGCEHPRYFPHITSYRQGDKSVKFAYVRRLQDSTACICFEAVVLGTQPEEHIVVKFVEQYGEDAHRWMADQHLAPVLRYFGPLDAESEHSYAGLSMVVMDLVEGKSLHDLHGATGEIPDDVIKEVIAAGNVLKARGFVHGDLRRPNIMILDTPANGTRVCFIDFDWAGLVDKVFYPFDLTSAITDATKAKDNDVVTVDRMNKLLAAMLGVPVSSV